MSPSVLVAGYTTRHVAKSAARAGYDVYAVDHFCDQDLLWCTKDVMAFDELDECIGRAAINWKFSRAYNKKGPVLSYVSHEDCLAPEQPVATFYGG